MAVKIKIKDYQSIKEAEIEVDGFTVVTGPNNSGKSALMRAVSGLFRNAALEEEGSVVRHGEDRFRVELDFGADGKVAWEKGPKIKPTYEVDGTTIHPGRDVPDEIKKFGVLPIQAGGRELWPNAAQQFDQVFLVDQPGSVIAEAVADAERVGKLNRALKASDSDRRKAGSELKIRRKDLKGYEDQMDGFDGLDDAVTAVGNLASQVAHAGKIAGAIKGLEDLQFRLSGARASVSALQGANDIPNSDMTLYTDADAAREEVEHAEILKQSLDSMQSEFKALAGFDEAVEENASPSDADMAKAQKVGSLYIEMDEIRRNRDARISTIEQLGVELASAKTQATAADAEVAEILGDLGECPTCGSPVESEGNHVHGEAQL
jgi:DNA repair exonuclease SbcCD ATPase subunit